MIERYRQWLLIEVRNPQSAAYRELVRLAELAEQGDLTIVCFCKPLACHGDVVKRAIEWVMRERAKALAPPAKEDPSPEEPGGGDNNYAVPIALLAANAQRQQPTSLHNH